MNQFDKDFDRKFKEMDREFDQNFNAIKSTVKVGAGMAVVGGLFTLAIYGSIAVAAIWSVGHFIFHAW